MVLQSRRVWLAGQFVPAQLETADGKIVNVYPFGTKTADVDYGNKRIVPGFIDVHTHGAYGFDTNDGEPEGLRDWMRRIPEEGVTSILPTTVTQMPEQMSQRLWKKATRVQRFWGSISKDLIWIWNTRVHSPRKRLQNRP